MEKKTTCSKSKSGLFAKKTSKTGITAAELIGVEKLRLKWTTITFKANYCKRILDGKTFTSLVSRTPVGEVSKYQELNLTEVSREELLEIRKSGVAGFVLKLGDKLYYTELSPEISLFSVNICGEHKCCCGQIMCHHLSAASDEDGGCAKVRGRSWGIERYDFITKGCETFRTRHDMFVVANCANYEESPPREQVSATKRKELRLELAKLMWDDIETLEQAQQRKRRNHERNVREATGRNIEAKIGQRSNKTGKDDRVVVAAKTAK